MPSQPQSADCGNQFYCAVAIKPINQFELYTGGCMLCLSRRIPINAEQDISPSVHDKLFLSASTAEANTLWNQSSPFCLWLSLLKSKFLIGKAVFYFAHKDYSKHQYIHQFGMFFFCFFWGGETQKRLLVDVIGLTMTLIFHHFIISSQLDIIYK